jgi:hypothetical protein
MFPYLRRTAQTNVNVKNLARVNDLYSRITSLDATAKMFLAEGAATVAAGDQGSLDFFAKRWFFIEESNRAKTAVYEEVIDQLIELLNEYLEKEGRRFSNKDLLEQNDSYRAVKSLEKDADSILGQMSLSKIYTSAKGIVLSMLSMLGQPKMQEVREIHPVLITSRYEELNSEKLLKYSYDGKLAMLMNCTAEGGTYRWQNTCYDQVKKQQEQLGRREEASKLLEESRSRLNGLIESINEASTQRQKNAIVDTALEIAFPGPSLAPQNRSRPGTFTERISRSLGFSSPTERGGKRKTRRNKRRRVKYVK